MYSKNVQNKNIQRKNTKQEPRKHGPLQKFEVDWKLKKTWNSTGLQKWTIKLDNFRNNII